MSDPSPLKIDPTPLSMSLKMFLLLIVFVGICGTRNGVISGCASATGSGAGRAFVTAISPAKAASVRERSFSAILFGALGSRQKVPSGRVLVEEAEWSI